MTQSPWSRDSWRTYDIKQVPEYPDSDILQAVENDLNKQPPLVFAGECDRLKQELAACVDGKAFLLQGGDCAEAFQEFHSDSIRDTYKVLLQMAVVLTFGGLKPTVKIGRLAGQFAKPRSEPMEEKNGVSLPSYRGDIVNKMAFTKEARTPNPKRMKQAYNQAASTLNLLRAFSDGGFADLHHVHQWTVDFIHDTKQKQRLQQISHDIEQCLSFMDACGITGKNIPQIARTDLYTSHESLLLWYEEALTRQDSLSGGWYDCSAHFLWIGDRTRYRNSAHVEFLRGVNNPIGIKCGPTTDIDELIYMINLLNPHNEKGRITLIVRMGADKIDQYFPNILRRITSEGLHVVWSSDPMHGNIEKVNNYKTRRLDNILKEVQSFFSIHQSENTHPGGVHFEMTGKNVTECLGGHVQVTPDDLEARYHTHCDPRLNGDQALELAFMIADLLKNNR